MNCEEIRNRLDELADVSPESEAGVAAHLEECARCRGEFEATRELVRRAAELPSEIEPPRDLWPNIAGRIEATRVVRPRFGAPLRRVTLLLAAAASLVFAVMVAYNVGRRQTPPVVLKVEATPQAETASIFNASVEEARADFGQARSELLQALELRRQALAPETLAIVERNLRVIDEAIDGISAALAEDPGNQMLADQLNFAYRQQIQLLQRATRLPAEI